MSAEGRTALKAYFETGDKPTQAQFENLIDSFVNKTDDVPFISTVLNLTEAQMRRLNTANGGLGFLMFSAPGANKFIEVANIKFLVAKTGGDLYEDNYSVQNADTSLICRGSVVDSNNFVQVLGDWFSDGSQRFAIDSAMYFWGLNDSGTFAGTGKILLDYRIVDVS